ncbi:hypothetical protein RUM43_003244 [Polyplax serrata]|uniref:Uncharacterized protein n=1 Tax=Polyplax serrata TaxID=468196 RepID=A0AAN8PP14_POLSC
MTDLLSSHGESFHSGNLLALESCRRYRTTEPNILNTELKHSKSDDLVLQGSPVESPVVENQPRPLSPNLPFEGGRCIMSANRPKSTYFSDSEPDVNNIKVQSVPVNSSKVNNSSVSSRHVGLYDNVDPEDSIRDMISENDFYRFVLFKSHYDKYLKLSLKYEEARNIAYYLEEKYHEIKVSEYKKT